MNNKDEIIFKLKDLYDDMAARKAKEPFKPQENHFNGFEKGYGSSPSSNDSKTKKLAINAGDSDSESDNSEGVVTTLLGSQEKAQKIIYDLE